MAGGTKLRRREVPWCTLFLVIASIASHTCVLVGNMKTSAAMKEIGASTSGWSGVGQGLARALRTELDALMEEVSTKVVDSMEMIMDVQGMIDSTLSLCGNSTDAAIAESASLLQTGAGNLEDPTAAQSAADALRPVIMQAIDALLENAFSELNKQLNNFLELIKPTLEQVADWILKFGTEIQASVEAFAITLDKAQKIFDQVMAQLNGKGDNDVDMLHETFTLFDVSGTGYVSIADLKEVAELFSIQALAGTKPEELVPKYDADGDGQLNEQEMLLFVDDEAVPNLMSSVLRIYAKKLAEVAANVANVQMRDEVALEVVHYLQLVCAKNMTKLGWVSDTLGNGSLPLDFTSAIFAQLCLTEGDPNLLTNEDVGQIHMSVIYDLHPKQTVAAADNMANTTYWEVNGFPILDQPRCVEKVTEWLIVAKTTKPPSLDLVQTGGTEKGKGTVVLSMLSSKEVSSVNARMLAEKRTKQHLVQKHQARAAHKAALFSSATSKSLLMRVTAGSTATSSNPNADSAVAAGQPATNESLLFAQWLSNNATATYETFMEMCFEYSSESSNAIDSFASSISGMVKMITGFLDTMAKWATPSGIARIESMVKDFAEDALDDVREAIQGALESFVDAALPAITGAIDGAINSTSHTLAEQVSAMIANPITAAIADPLTSIVSSQLGDALGENTGEVMASVLGDVLSDKSTEVLEGLIHDSLEALVDKALTGATGALDSALSLAEVNSSVKLQQEQKAAQLRVVGQQFTHDLVVTREVVGAKRVKNLQKREAAVSQAITTVIDTLKTLLNLLPSASDLLKASRKMVSSAVSGLDSIFDVFAEKGPEIFDSIAFYWSLLWTLYFCLLAPLSLFLLYYGFWAGGFFGGPQPISDDDGNGGEFPSTPSERFRVCVTSCCVCLYKYHDAQMCFWSVIILLQIIVLVIFVVSIALCIVSGVQAFITAGCAQVYVLGDPAVCTETIGMLRQFLATFFVADAVEELNNVCNANKLVTCELISAKMKTSAILTTVFSFIATILSLQMLIESGVLHEQARYRRMYNKQLEEDAARKEPC